MLRITVDQSSVAPLSWSAGLDKQSSLPPAAEGSRALMPVSSRGRDSYVALENLVKLEELSVVFQPIVSMSDGALFAHEALVRCSRREFRSPPVLFERAVSSGCVGRLGRMIRDLAVPLASGTPLFLNVHPLELEEPWLVRPDDPIYSHDADVYLEITESVPLTHFELCHHVLKEVRVRGGVHLVVDDLGAGYSNLKRIIDLEPRVVKLDRELIVGIDKNKRQQSLVINVVRLCADLSATVVAEGIETEDEFNALRDTGVHYGQGFLFARPEYPMPMVTWPPDATP
jgi:EAL domain-containing protein (putative c-di-GMP-specific phosphodiesterase class I)